MEFHALVDTAPVKLGNRSSRRKMALAQKARWARIKAEIEPPSPPAPESPRPKRRINAEGMKRIIAATKKGWRLQKAAARATAA